LRNRFLGAEGIRDFGEEGVERSSAIGHQKPDSSRGKGTAIGAGLFPFLLDELIKLSPPSLSQDYTSNISPGLPPLSNGNI
jgi:hypothetical protein